MSSPLFGAYTMYVTPSTLNAVPFVNTYTPMTYTVTASGTMPENVIEYSNLTQDPLIARESNDTTTSPPIETIPMDTAPAESSSVHGLWGADTDQLKTAQVNLVQQVSRGVWKFFERPETVIANAGDVLRRAHDRTGEPRALKLMGADEGAKGDSSGKVQGVEADEFGLSNADVAELERRMRKSRFSTGFLGESESLRNVLRSDSETLKRYGISHEEVAELLNQVVSGRIDDYQVEVGGERYSVQAESTLGHEECPYGQYEDKPDGTLEYVHKQPIDHGLDVYYRGSRDYQITNVRTGESLSFGGLLVHLIRVHKFFEGEGTRYRLPPERVIQFFGMDKGNRSATVIGSPRYLYESYGQLVLFVLSDLKSLSAKGITIEGYSGDTGLKKLFTRIDELSFVDPGVRQSWKQRATEIVGNFDKEDASHYLDHNRALLARLASEIESVIILSSGFVPDKYLFNGTTARLPADVERFRAAKVLKTMQDDIRRWVEGEISFIGNRASFRRGMTPVLRRFESEMTSHRGFTYDLTDAQFSLIRGIVAQISDIMISDVPYAQSKEKLYSLLESLRQKTEAEFSAARDGLSVVLE